MTKLDRWKLAREYGARITERSVRELNRRAKVENEDTKMRKEIQNRIIDLVGKGKTTEEIKEILSQEPSYSKYSKYVQSWIEHFQRKIQPQKPREDEER